ncbi:MAG: nicotinate-nicotinamide nucleotide adenylyltransferase [Thermoleophilia bacterium]|nr:nicotinate-nicotinamide nucleotide adenylyltransferase [Thermoleophilia bacterium]
MMDPPHLGHVAIVDAVHDACGLDRVVVVPSGVPPHREASKVSARARLTMAVRAFADLDHVVVSDTEVDRAEHGETGYMVDTLEELRDLPSLLGYDDLEVVTTLVVGADQAVTLPTWHRFDRITELAEVAIVRRPDQLDDADLDAALADLREAWGIAPTIVDMSAVPISSTLVRAVAGGGDRAAVAALVPGAIVDDVLRLYGPGDVASSVRS